MRVAVRIALLAAAPMAGAAGDAPVESDYLIRDFRFASGEVLPELRMHYVTLGEPVRDATGAIGNAVLVLHGTAGSSGNFLGSRWMDELFGRGQPLDASRYYIILPDNLGHGKSSKPSDGLRTRFPRYGYEDMVRAQQRLVTERLGVERLRLLIGTSMGGMHAWLWAQRWPERMQAVMPMVCLPARIGGRNRMVRRLIIDAIRNDAGWNGGDYVSQPRALATVLQMGLINASGARELYAAAPTADAADRMLDGYVAQRLARVDANDVLYAWEASADYDPGPGLERISAPVLAVNFADDEVNPPELGVLEREIRRVPRGRHVLIPAGDATRGHRSYYEVGLWKEHLVKFLQDTE
jgi:homoserine O-acetyltransferase